jgi:hypothetical protein
LIKIDGEVSGGFFFTDRGGFNCSAYQHPRRDKYTVAGEKKRYKLFFFKACIYKLFEELRRKSNKK